MPNPERVQWIFFDFAGTLAFNDPARPWNYVWACARRGFFFDRREVRPHIDAVWGKMDTPEGIEHPDASVTVERYDLLRAALEREILERIGIPEAAGREEMVRELLAVQDSPESYTVYPEVCDTLQALADAGYRMAIVSNFNWTLPEISVEIGLGRYMTEVVTSARVGYRKPHHRIYQAALEITGAVPEDSLFVGDSLGPDYDGPAAVGFQALLVDRRGSGRHKVPTITRISDLPALLAGPAPVTR